MLIGKLNQWWWIHEASLVVLIVQTNLHIYLVSTEVLTLIYFCVYRGPHTHIFLYLQGSPHSYIFVYRGLHTPHIFCVYRGPHTFLCLQGSSHSPYIFVSTGVPTLTIYFVFTGVPTHIFMFTGVITLTIYFVFIGVLTLTIYLSYWQASSEDRWTTSKSEWEDFRWEYQPWLVLSGFYARYIYIYVVTQIIGLFSFTQLLDK